MPRAVFPLTPGSSTDIKGQDGSQHLSALHLAFELPPPALYDAARASPTDYKQSPTGPLGAAPHIAQTRQLYPMQAAETVKSRRRSSAAKEQKEDAFALPPPPTRSRKIIQMKPKAQEDDQSYETAGSRQNKAGKSPATAAKTSAGPKEQGKKKQPSASSAAGRKIARKTAHSLIERRRRSKMNEEFALLKSMIPACTGEMHKLAILQVSRLQGQMRRGRFLAHKCTTGVNRLCSLPRRLRSQAEGAARRQPGTAWRSSSTVDPGFSPYFQGGRRARRRRDVRHWHSLTPTERRNGCHSPSLRVPGSVRPGLTPPPAVAVVRVHRPQALQLQHVGHHVPGDRAPAQRRGLCREQRVRVRLDVDVSGPGPAVRRRPRSYGGAVDAQQRSTRRAERRSRDVSTGFAKCLDEDRMSFLLEIVSFVPLCGRICG